MAIRLIISDFDGTLVDTFEANYRAYSDAFAAQGLELSREKYRECFGFRFDRFMDCMNVDDTSVRNTIREIKSERYPDHFDSLVVNIPLLDFIRAFKCSGGCTAIASTARRKNLLNALRYIGADNDFDFVLAGENVVHGKPNPEIYNKVLEMAACNPDEAIVFEDSAVGFEAARAAQIPFIAINKNFYNEHRG